MAVIGLDLGATKLAGALFGPDGEIIERAGALLEGRDGDGVGRLIAEQVAALREAATLRSVASLAVAAAHEINNPLTVVSGELQLLAREIGARWSGRIGSMLEALERIREVVLRMNRITRLETAERQRHLPEMLDLEKSSGRLESQPPESDQE